MSASTWGFGVPDDSITKQFPALVFVPQETGGRYVEVREIAGDLWIARNALFNTSSLQWLQPNPPCDFTQTASATVYRATGSVQFFNIAASGSATQPLNWGSPYWQLDPTGSSSALGATRSQIVNNVLADGSAVTPVVFATPFSNACSGVVLGALNNFQLNRWQLTIQYDSPTVNGFNLNVGGAPAGQVISVFYIAVGN